jgi:RNA polymerase sigma-70 factor (ECF subfamily)
MLAEDALAYSDGGGKVAAARNPIYGANKVARFVLVVPRKEQVDRVEVREVNGQPAVVTWLGHRLTNVVQFEFDGDRIANCYMQRNPDKLRRLRRLLQAEAPKT